ncbi:hypothetical protein HY636_03355 [Candidatus Woesearchaeota archaeon]|nr:hypothetical protein [Candidatus Woesearchaeota archaeon]
MALTQPNTQPQTLAPQRLGLAGLTQVHIKRPDDDGSDDSLDDGLDDLIRRHTAQKPEKRREIKVSRNRSNKLKSLLRTYEQYLTIEGVPQLEFVRKNLENKMVLTPLEINAFLQMTLESEGREKDYMIEGAGMFISTLIQNSYNARHNHFVLDTSNLRGKIDKLGWFIKGSSKRLINIKVFGDLGNDCFDEGKYLSVDIYGNVGSGYATNVKYSSLKIDGNAGEWCCSNAEYSSVIINGNAKDKCGHNAKASFFVIKGYGTFEIHYFHAENSSYRLDGDLIGIKFGGGCSNCEFLTPNKRTLKKLLQSDLKSGTKNKIYFVRANGTKKLIEYN